MSDTGESRNGARAGAVVRSIPQAVERPCARPSCGAPASATLTFRYGTREAWVARLGHRNDPQAYDLCATHAARTRPPQGWELRDRRPEDERRPDVPHTTPVDLGGDRTVALLAAALRSVPDPVSEDAVADDAGVDRAVVPVDPAPSRVPIDDGDPPALDLGLEPTPDTASSATEAGPPGDGVAGEEPAPAVEDVDRPRPPLAARQRDASDVASAARAADW